MRRRICLFLALLCLLFSACQDAKDDLDRIKQYKPDDKYFKANLVSLHFIIETSQIPRVDSVFGQVIKANNLPLTAAGCKDGIYTGESPYDAYDYRHVVEIRIKDEKIVSVDYNEIKKGGMGKQEDEEYCEEMSVTGTTPAIAYPQLEGALVEKQDVLKVDAVTGASYSLYRFRYAVIIALMKARIAALRSH